MGDTRGGFQQEIMGMSQQMGATQCENRWLLIQPLWSAFPGRLSEDCLCLDIMNIGPGH